MARKAKIRKKPGKLTDAQAARRTRRLKREALADIERNLKRPKLTRFFQ